MCAEEIFSWQRFSQRVDQRKNIEVMKRIEIKQTDHSRLGEITIAGFSQEELEKVEGVIRGNMWWMTVGDDGEPVFLPRYESPPDPILDEEMFPFWRLPTEAEKNAVYSLLGFDAEVPSHNYPSPSIHIRYLCGYHYSPGDYQKYAERLESYGFECFRSRRGDDGHFSEEWILSDLYFAQGDLKHFVETLPQEKDRIREACEFIRKHVLFGTLDVCVQRMAMTVT